MKFLADECCDAFLVDALRREGFDVLSVLETMKGAIDEEVLARATEEKRILLTEDKDFGELVFRLQLFAVGIVLLRFSEDEVELKMARTLELIRDRSADMAGHFIVLEADKMRLRPLLIRDTV